MNIAEAYEFLDMLGNHEESSEDESSSDSDSSDDVWGFLDDDSDSSDSSSEEDNEVPPPPSSTPGRNWIEQWLQLTDWMMRMYNKPLYPGAPLTVLDHFQATCEIVKRGKLSQVIIPACM